MALADDIASDYTLFDGVVTVTYTPRSGAAVATAKALRRAVRRGRVAQHGTEHAETTWHVWAATISGVTCQLGDKLAYGGETWIVKEVSLETMGTRWRLTCAKAAVNG